MTKPTAQFIGRSMARRIEKGAHQLLPLPDNYELAKWNNDLILWHKHIFDGSTPMCNENCGTAPHRHYLFWFIHEVDPVSNLDAVIQFLDELV